MFAKILLAAGEFNESANTLADLFKDMFKPLILLVGSIMGIWGVVIGIKFMRASGDENKQKAAKSSLVHFIIGIVVMFAVAGVAPLVIYGFQEWMDTVGKVQNIFFPPAAKWLAW